MTTLNNFMRCFTLSMYVLVLAIWAIFEFVWLLNAILSAVIYCKIATWYYDESHGLMHHITVAYNTFHIAWDEKIDLHHTVLLIIAALVHDSVDYKYCKTDQEKENANKKLMWFLAWIVGSFDAGRIYIWITHSSYSKEKILAYKINNGIPNKKTLGVIGPDKKYTRILADADRIDSISPDKSETLGRPMGIERCYQYTKNANPNYSPSVHWKLVVKHCEDKLNDLDYWILTKKGKELAKPGIDAIRKWYTENVNNKFFFDLPLIKFLVGIIHNVKSLTVFIIPRG